MKERTKHRIKKTLQFFLGQRRSLFDLHDRRRDLTKQIDKMGEEAKVAIRNTRRDALEKLKGLKKANTITEDDEANGEKKIQNLTDKYCKEIDVMAADKEKEILEI